MAMKNDAKFEEKLTLGFKIDMKNLVNFHPTTQQSKNVSSMGYFCPKYMRFELKKIQMSLKILIWAETLIVNSINRTKYIFGK